MIQNQQRYGEHCHIYHTANGQRFADLDVDKDRQRNVDQQTQITHADAEQVLDDGTDTV